MDQNQDIFRQLQELALAYGRKRQSAQTGYLHYCYGQEQEPHLPIPVVENFLFALALLRSKTIENVNEAKTILDGLLHFQNRRENDHSFGNFPIYLHEFPACKDRFTGVQVAVTIYWILKQFHQVLGHELNQRLENCLLELIQYILKAHTEKAAPYHIAIRIAAVGIAGGRLLHKPELEEQGHALLNALCSSEDKSAWYCPAAMGSILTAIKMVYGNIANSPWKAFWQHITETWHRETATYVGPAVRVWQNGSEPQVTLYDLFLGSFTDSLSARMLKESPAHLEAVLISPTEQELLPEISYPLHRKYEFDGTPCELFQDANFAYSMIEQGKSAVNPAFVNGFHSFYLVWSDKGNVHCLVCQGGNSKRMRYSAENHKIEMWFDFDSPVDVEDREKSREVCFFVDAHADLEMAIADGKASTFCLGDPIQVRSGKHLMTLTFSLESGAGRFLGHRMPTNRPAQQNARGFNRYEAYDRIVFLRTLGRSEKCCIKVDLQLQIV